MKVFQVVLLLVCLFNLAGAQQEYNLQQCIETALKNNIRLKQSQLSLSSYKIDIMTSKAAMYPNLNGSISETNNLGRNIDPISNTYISSNTQSTNLGVSSSIIVFNGFQLLNNYRMAKVNFEASGSDVKAMQNDLSLQVAAAYLQVLYAEDNLVNAKAQLNVTANQRTRTDQLVKAGKLAESSLYELDAQQANDEYNVQMAENGIQSARLTLLQLMELPASTAFTLQRPILSVPATESYNSDAIYSMAIGQRPEVVSAQLRRDAALLSQKVSAGAFYPRVSLTAGVNTLYSSKFRTMSSVTPAGERLLGYTHKNDSVFTTNYNINYSSVKFMDQLDQNFGKFVSVGLTVPVFNNMRVYGSYQKARLNIANQELNLAQTKNTLMKSIQQAVTDVQAARAKFLSAQKSVDAQNINYNNVELRYNQGLSSFLDFITAKNNKARAEINLQQARYDLILKSKIIDFYKGVNITF